MTVVEKEVVVSCPHGVHGRVATKLAVIARERGISLQLLHDETYIDCTSILDVLSMAFTCGSRFLVRIEGDEDVVACTIPVIEDIFAGKGEP